VAYPRISATGSQAAAGVDAMTQSFKPFVWHLGDHLNGHGQRCSCKRENKSEPSFPAVQAEAEPKKLSRVNRIPTWADAERLEAEKRGVPVYLQSRDWGKK
jgi:hypothetical protein